LAALTKSGVKELSILTEKKRIKKHTQPKGRLSACAFYLFVVDKIDTFLECIYLVPSW